MFLVDKVESERSNPCDKTENGISVRQPKNQQPARLQPLQKVAEYEIGAANMAGRIIVAPPGAAWAAWARDLADPVVAMASGWMGVRAQARRRDVEVPLVISDHADWDELTVTIAEVAADDVWITHGRHDALARHLSALSQPCRPLDTVVRGAGAE